MNNPRNEPRICVASSGLGHVARGVEAWAHELAAALRSRGANVLLCSGAALDHSTLNRSPLDEAEQDRTTYHRVIPCRHRESAAANRLLDWIPRRIGWRIGMGSPYEVEQTTFAWNLIGILRRQRVDILHVQDPLVALLVQRARQLRWLSTRVILAHGTEEPLWFQSKIRYLQHLAPWHAEQADQAGIGRPTWTTIPNFIDPQTFHPGTAPRVRRELSLPDQAFVVLAVAAIKRQHKRIDYLCAEIHRLVQQRPELPIHLVIAGGWEAETDELIRQEQQRLGDRVRFLVRFPRQQMPDLYRAADVFTLGSLKEMMPMALLEATASGLPCVVNAHPVMQWMIGPGGKAMDMRQPGALAEQLAALHDDPTRRRELGRRARQHCELHFAQDRVVDQIETYYRSVVSPAGASTSAAASSRCTVSSACSAGS